MKNNIKEIVVAVAIILIALLLLNPFDFWMPTMMVWSMLAAVLVLFGVFTSFILRENSIDERDSAHRTIAGRNAFLVGSFMLMLGIVFQSRTHTVDPWLVVALVLMVVTKLGTRMWSDRNR